MATSNNKVATYFKGKDYEDLVTEHLNLIRNFKEVEI